MSKDTVVPLLALKQYQARCLLLGPASSSVTNVLEYLVQTEAEIGSLDVRPRAHYPSQRAVEIPATAPMEDEELANFIRRRGFVLEGAPNPPFT